MLGMQKEVLPAWRRMTTLRRTILVRRSGRDAVKNFLKLWQEAI
jgi:hypothetical protein